MKGLKGSKKEGVFVSNGEHPNGNSFPGKNSGRETRGMKRGHFKWVASLISILLAVCIAMPAAAFASGEMPNNGNGGGR